MRILDLTRRILDLVGRPESLVQQVEDRQGHDRRYALDTTKLQDLGWRPAVDFDDGLARTVEWYRTHEPWWRPIKEQDPAFREYYRAQYVDRAPKA